MCEPEDGEIQSGRRISFLLKAAQLFTIRYGFTRHKDDAAATPIDMGGPVRVFVDGCEPMKIQL
ncbi:MAG TPA: hypothetical protein VGG80_10275 [Acidobacteriaceae bacterium]|jgi:hypothetical protein